jgi:hypothetical protein
MANWKGFGRNQSWRNRYTHLTRGTEGNHGALSIRLRFEPNSAEIRILVKSTQNIIAWRQRYNKQMTTESAVLIALTIMRAVFWGVTPCTSGKRANFSEHIAFVLQGLLFDSDDGGIVFPRNVFFLFCELHFILPPKNGTFQVNFWKWKIVTNFVSYCSTRNSANQTGIVASYIGVYLHRYFCLAIC